MKYINLDEFGRQKDPFYFALEDHLLQKTGDFSFIWEVFPAVIIGKHQVLRKEVNLEYLKENNINIYRRPSGGGAVYSDEGCIKYTFIRRNINKDQMYKESLTVIQDFLKTLGLEVEFSGRNDLVINGAKFSGNAYYQTKDGMVLHGTILFDTDLEKLGKVLTPSQDKIASKGVNSVKSRVINLSSLLDISRDEFLLKFKKYMSINEIKLKSDDINLMQDKIKMFHSLDYIYGKEPKHLNTVSKRYPFGEVSINYEAKDNTITNILISGDFFEKENIKELEAKLIGYKLYSKDLNIDISKYIENMTNDQFINLLKG